MTTASRASVTTSATTSATLTIYVQRGLEVLWLLTAAVVPLLFVPKDFMLSEAVNAYVEVPKTTAFRTLVGMMTILWLSEWVLRGGLHRRYTLAHYLSRLWNWLSEQPSRWIVVAATFYVAVAIVTTLLSTSLWTSMWGEVPGQYGYSAYTSVSYFILFAVIATHLKTQPQLWRLLGVIVATGALVGLYGVIQHYGVDPLDLGETGSARVTATMANPVFTGAFFVMSALLTLGVGLTVLDRMGWTPVRAVVWIVLIAAQFMVVFWTGSRGSFLLGMPVGLLAFVVLAPFVSGMRGLAKTAAMLVAGLLITLVVIVSTPSPSDASSGAVDASTTAVGQAEERLSSIGATAVRGGVSYRIDIWDGGMGLVLRRPWFEFEDLRFSFLRPLIGYGPEMFKYTFPLESPLGGLLSQAHNFFLHHWIEQGILGLFSSLGLFVAFFSVGLAQLWRNRDTYSTTHKWILVALLATMAGRVAELMVGVARESDLVLLWIMLAILVVLPTVMKPSPEVETTSAPDEPSRAPLRRDRRGARAAARREEQARLDAGRRVGGGVGPTQVVGVAIVAAVIVFIGWLSWDKNVDYAWAAVVAASARDQFSGGTFPDNFLEGERKMAKAASKAPNVPNYYHNLAGIYDSYRNAALNNPEANLRQCAEFFSSVEPGEFSGIDPRYATCAVAAYQNNVEGFRKNVYSPQVKLMLANSSLEMAALGYKIENEELEGDEAIRLYNELTQMIPASWPLNNALATAYLRLGRNQEALAPLQKSIALSQGAPESARALNLKGIAHRRLGQNQQAIDSLQQSLAVSGERENANVSEARRQLVITYNTQANTYIQEREAVQALETLEKSLDINRNSPESAVALYLKGLAYRQMDELPDAIESLEQSVKLDGSGPHVIEAHRNLAELYTNLGDSVKAGEHFKKFQELSQS